MTYSEEQALKNRMDELLAENKRMSKIIYILNKLVIDLEDLHKRKDQHSCVLKRRNCP